MQNKVLEMKNYLFVCLFVLFSIDMQAQNFNNVAEQLDLVGHYGNGTGAGRGGGMSFVDFNNDGYPDLTMCTELGQNVLFFENKISHFEKVEPAFINNTFETKQVLWIDVENDGDLDLYVTAYNAPDYLYINDGNNNFQIKNWLFGLPVEFGLTYGANFADINKDGYLDLYASKYTNNVNFGDGANQLYLFNPNTTSYNNISFSAGITNGTNPTFCSVFFDYDFDGDLDFYIANDCYGPGTQNQFYVNNSDNTFTEISALNGTELATTCSMNTGLSDYDNNGFWDIYVTNFSTAPSSLLSCNANGFYNDVAVASNTTLFRYGWTANFLDYDNDADEDLYVCASNAANGAPSAFYVNNTFGFTEPLYNLNGLGNNDTLGSFANAIGDFNKDGFIDIVSSGNNDHNFKLYANYENNYNKFFKLKLIGNQSNNAAIGARVEIYHNNDKRIFQKHAANGFLNQNEDLIHIGFGDAIEFDSLMVFWPFESNRETIHHTAFLNSGVYTIAELQGVTNFESLELCSEIHEVQINPIPSQIYGSVIKTFSSKTIENYFNVIFKSECLVELNIGFEVKVGGSLLAQIDNCN